MLIFQRDKGASHASDEPVPGALQESGAGNPEGGEQASLSRVPQVVHEKAGRAVSHIPGPRRREEVSLQRLWEEIQGEHASHSPHEKSYR